MTSQNNSDYGSRLSSQLQQNKQPIFVFGMYFCATCKNLLSPTKSKQQTMTMQFKCPKCQIQNVDFTYKMGQKGMLYCKQLKMGTRSYRPGIQLIFDPTIPQIQVECPQCEYMRAVCLLTPNEGQTKIIATMICGSRIGTTAKCGNIWTLPANKGIFDGKVEQYYVRK